MKVSAAFLMWILPGNRLVLLLTLLWPPGALINPVVRVPVPLGTRAIWARATNSNENRTMIMKTVTEKFPESFYVNG